MSISYIGSGPYCYANSLAMVLGPGAPHPSAIEVLTGSPFGLHVRSGLASFDPLGWDPDMGVDAALDLLGWACERSACEGPCGRAAARRGVPGAGRTGRDGSAPAPARDGGAHRGRPLRGGRGGGCRHGAFPRPARAPVRHASHGGFRRCLGCGFVGISGGALHHAYRIPPAPRGGCALRAARLAPGRGAGSRRPPIVPRRPPSASPGSSRKV